MANNKDLETNMNAYVDKLQGRSSSSGLVKTASSADQSYYRHMNYRTSFLTLSDMEIPDDYRLIFRWCRYFFKFDPLVGPAIRALATFPITDWIVNDSDTGEEQTKDREDSTTLKFYQNMLRDINLTKLLMEIGYNYHLYANVIIFAEPTMKEYRYRDDNGQIQKKRELTWKSINVLDPALITKDIDPKTNETIYYYEVPADIRLVIEKKKPKEKYDKIPQIYKDAVKKKKPLKLNSKFIYDMSMPKEAGDNGKWSTPPILHALKLILYTNVLRQAQEAIAYEHIVPRRIYFFQETNESSIMNNFEQITDDFTAQLNMQLRDPNYQIVSPIPIQEITHGGQGRGLLLTPEIEQLNGQILAALRCPKEFIFGGMSYSGSTTSLRILENDFITYRELLHDFVNNFVIKRLAELRGEWEVEDDDKNLVTVTFSDLKMQDDIQQKQLMVQLNQGGKMSDETLYEKVLGLEANTIKTQLKNESLEQVKNQMELQKLQEELMAQLGEGPNEQNPEANPQGGQPAPEQPSEEEPPQQEQAPQQAPAESEEAKAQALAQKFGLELNMFESGSELNARGAHTLAQKLANAEPDKVEEVVRNFGYTTQTSVKAYIEYIKDERQAEQSQKINMKPMPEKLPPRRQGGV